MRTLAAIILLCSVPIARGGGPRFVAGTSFPVYTVHPETEILTPISGTSQFILTGQPIAPVTLRLVAPARQPVVGGIVTLTGAIRAWTPPCPEDRTCDPGRLLAPISMSGTSANDGSVSFLLVPIGNTAARIPGLATAGSSSAVAFTTEISP